MFGIEIVKLAIEATIIPWLCADDCDDFGGCTDAGVHVGAPTRPI